MADNKTILDALLSYKSVFDREELIPAFFPEASQLIHNNNFAFISACCLDRGTKAEIIWTIPFWISQQVGHFDPYRFYDMSLDEIALLFQRLPRKPRYLNAAPRTFQSVTRIVVDNFSGVCENIWKHRRAVDVKKVLLSVYGVGNGITNMTLLLIESAFGIRFSDLDYSNMDIKSDVHTMRVLYRLGVSDAINEYEATRASRLLSPTFPGLIDGPLWSIGRKFCHASAPNCSACPMILACPKEGV